MDLGSEDDAQWGLVGGVLGVPAYGVLLAPVGVALACPGVAPVGVDQASVGASVGPAVDSVPDHSVEDVEIHVHVGVALGHVGVALGHVGVALVHVGEALGHVGEVPGHAGVALGHVGEAPGHVGVAPGHVGEAPGHVGEAPGHEVAPSSFAAHLGLTFLLYVTGSVPEIHKQERYTNFNTWDNTM